MGIGDSKKIILPLGILMSSSVSLEEKGGREEVCKGKSTTKKPAILHSEQLKKINNNNDKIPITSIVIRPRERRSPPSPPLIRVGRPLGGEGGQGSQSRG